jgi:sulfur carrier protein
MKLKINGKEEILDKDALNIKELLVINKVQMPDMVSVELNGTILEKNEYESSLLKDGDAIEFLYFMGGGQEQDFQTKAVHGG